MSLNLVIITKYLFVVEDGEADYHKNAIFKWVIIGNIYANDHSKDDLPTWNYETGPKDFKTSFMTSKHQLSQS